MEDPSRPSSHAAFEDRARAAFAGLTRAMPPTSREMATETATTASTTAADLAGQGGVPSSSPPALSQQPAAVWSVSASAATARKNAVAADDFSEDEEADERVRVGRGGEPGGAADESGDEQRKNDDDPLGLSREARERGFLASDAYCRQLDKEEEFDEIDAIADPGEAERETLWR
jgi:hypothetical protein